jgi:hypothetical protein
MNYPINERHEEIIDIVCQWPDFCETRRCLEDWTKEPDYENYTLTGLMSEIELIEGELEQGEAVLTKFVEHAGHLNRHIEKTRAVVAKGYDAIRLFYDFRRKEANKAISKSEVRRLVFQRDGFTCNHCGCGSSLSVDHIKPVKAGGDDSLSNLQTLCRSCNSKKGSKYE